MTKNWYQEQIDTLNKGTIILTLLKKGGTSFKELREKTGLSKPVLSRHIADLENDGVIEYSPDKKDRRKKIYHLTDGWADYSGAYKTSMRNFYIAQRILDELILKSDLDVPDHDKLLVKYYGIVPVWLASIGESDDTIMKIISSTFSEFKSMYLGYLPDPNFYFATKPKSTSYYEVKDILDKSEDFENIVSLLKDVKKIIKEREKKLERMKKTRNAK